MHHAERKGALAGPEEGQAGTDCVERAESQ